MLAAWPQKHRYSYWNYVAFMWIRCNFYFQLMAAIFYFQHTLRHRTVFPPALRIARPRKQRYSGSRWNFVAIMYASCDKRYRLYLLPVNGRWPPSSISNIPRRRTAISLVSPRSPIPRTWLKPLTFCCFIMYWSWDKRYVISASGWWPPSLSSDIFRCWTVFPLNSPCCLTPKPWG